MHRDLKSLNLLLDLKWNVKVSDFGLTKFRDEMKKGRSKDVQGSLFWTAPEVIDLDRKKRHLFFMIALAKLNPLILKRV